MQKQNTAKDSRSARIVKCNLFPARRLPRTSQQALVPVARSEFASESENSDEDPFCKFWAGNDPRIHAELCLILEEERIPYRTIRREDRLFHFTVKAR